MHFRLSLHSWAIHRRSQLGNPLVPAKQLGMNSPSHLPGAAIRYFCDLWGGIDVPAPMGVVLQLWNKQSGRNARVQLERRGAARLRSAGSTFDVLFSGCPGADAHDPPLTSRATPNANRNPGDQATSGLRVFHSQKTAKPLRTTRRLSNRIRDCAVASTKIQPDAATRLGIG